MSHLTGARFLTTIVVLFFLTIGCVGWPIQSMTTDGYVDMNGFYVQWGRETSSSDSTEYFAFPIAFPTKCVHVDVNIRTANIVTQLSVLWFNRTHFSIDRDSDIDGSVSFSYFAMGYDSTEVSANHPALESVPLGPDSTEASANAPGVASVPRDPGSPEVSLQAFGTNGYVNVSGFVWQWGQDDSTSDSLQSFDYPVDFYSDAWPNCWPTYGGINTMEANVKTQLGIKDVNRDTFTIDRDSDLDGSNHFSWTAFCFPCSPGWCNPVLTSNMGGFIVKGGYAYISNSDSLQYFEFTLPFPNSCFHVSINIETANIKYQLGSSTWNSTHFGIDRSGDIDGSISFSWIAIGH